MNGEYINLETTKELANKERVINILLSRISKLEYEVERLESKINQVEKYVDKMSYEVIIDNPKKDLQKILRK